MISLVDLSKASIDLERTRIRITKEIQREERTKELISQIKGKRLEIVETVFEGKKFFELSCFNEINLCKHFNTNIMFGPIGCDCKELDLEIGKYNLDKLSSAVEEMYGKGVRFERVTLPDGAISERIVWSK